MGSVERSGGENGGDGFVKEVAGSWYNPPLEMKRLALGKFPGWDRVKDKPK